MDAANARDRLEQERTRLTRLLEETTGAPDEGFGFEGTTSEAGGLNDGMGGDAATQLHDREVEQSVRGHLEAELTEIEAALQRVEDDTYGTCEIGGEPIADERLELVPATRWCAEHAEQGENQRGVTTRGTGGLSGDLEQQRRDPA